MVPVNTTAQSEMRRMLYRDAIVLGKVDDIEYFLLNGVAYSIEDGSVYRAVDASETRNIQQLCKKHRSK